MPSLSANGIVLRQTRYSDTSLITSWLTAEHGKVRTIAKGALRPKSPLFGKLDLFFHAELLWSPSRRSDLHVLREVRVIEAYPEIRASYARTLAASYFAELLDEAVEPEHPVPELYQLLLRAMGYLNARLPDRRAVMFFERELCRHLGVDADRDELAASRLQDTLGRLPDSRSDLWTRLASAP